MNNFLNSPAAAPAPKPVNTQIDGTPTNMGEKPTKARLETRSASPAGNNTSGMERALAAQADKLHPPRRR